MAFETPQLLDRSHLLEGMIRVGRVTKVRTKGCIAASVTYPDRNFQTAYLQVLQRNTLGCQDFYVPEVGENVWVLHPPAAMSRALILGSTYTSGNPPPFNDKAIRGVVFADGTYVIYDTRNGGNYQINTPGKITVNGGADVTVATTGNINITSGNIVLITASKVKITGELWVDTIRPYQQSFPIAFPRVSNNDGSGNGS